MAQILKKQRMTMTKVVAELREEAVGVCGQTTSVSSLVSPLRRHSAKQPLWELDVNTMKRLCGAVDVECLSGET